MFDAVFANMSPDPRVLALANSAPEYVRPAGTYIASRISAEMIASGRRHAERLSNTLRRIEEKYGVEREILVSIWAIKSGFGAVKGNHDVIRSLATLAHARFRGDEFFRDELLHALAILQAGDVPRERLVGSWAGAMGQPQFLPSSFLRHAADGSGDGRRDIWTNEADVLASIANYFKNFGWKRGQPWGFEVAVPEGYDFRFSRGTFAEWAARGFRRTDGGAFPQGDSAYLLFPAGARGPAFLVTDNYVVIKRYNFSDPYALAVAHLAERMRGGCGVARQMAGERAPALAQRPHRAATRARRARIQRRQFRRAPRFRAARHDPRAAGGIPHGAGRQSGRRAARTRPTQGRGNEEALNQHPDVRPGHFEPAEPRRMRDAKGREDLPLARNSHRGRRILR